MIDLDKHGLFNPCYHYRPRLLMLLVPYSEKRWA